MGGDRKAYSEDEFAIILAKAAELSTRSSSQGDPPQGLTLQEMKTIAQEVGLDPELVERAAHLLPGVTKSPLMSRLFGGPFSSQVDLYIPVPLTQQGARQLLSLVRATLLTQGRGDANVSGMSFSSFQHSEKVFISAHLEGDGTRIRVVVDNRGRLVLPLVLASVGTVMVTYLAIGVGGSAGGVGPASLPYLVLGGGIATVAGLLWRSIRKTAQRTLGTLDGLVDILSSYARRKDAS